MQAANFLCFFFQFSFHAYLDFDLTAMQLSQQGIQVLRAWSVSRACLFVSWDDASERFVGVAKTDPVNKHKGKH